jgi:hypothetical protein
MEVTNAGLACLASTRTGALVLMVGPRRVRQRRSNGKTRAVRENHRPGL